MKIKLLGLAFVALAALTLRSPAQAADVICYNCPPQWADWASMLKAIKADLGYDIPHDNKNSGQTLSQLIAEKGNPVADIAYMGVDVGYKAKEAGVLEPYKPKGFDDIPAGLKDPEGYWYAIHYGTLGLFVNKDALGGKPVPACWKDLLKPDYKGMVGYLDPSSASVGFVGAVAVNQALGGNEKNFDKAIEFFKGLAKNGAIVPKQTSYARVVSGEIPILFDYDFNAYRGKYTEKGNFEFVIPCEGSVTFPYVEGLVKNAPNKEKAKKVLDFLLSDKGQAIWTNAYLHPARNVPLPDAVSKRFLPAKDYERAKSVELGRALDGAEGVRGPLSRRSAMMHHGAPADLGAPFLSMRLKTFVWLCLLPLAVVVLAFFVLPMVRLMIVGGSGPQGLAAYAAILTEPRYRATLINTVVLAAATTIVSLVVATIAGLFLQRTRFPGRSVLVAMLTFPLAFPGVVVGFMIILLAGRQGLIGDLTLRAVGRKAGVRLYDSGPVPRLPLFLHSARDPHHHGGGREARPELEEAARALGAGPWAVHRDVILPALGPAFVASGAIAFATAMGAFGTAFTLATNIDVLPMLIYTEFTLSANIAIAAALSVVLGLVAWVVLALARIVRRQFRCGGGIGRCGTA